MVQKHLKSYSSSFLSWFIRVIKDDTASVERNTLIFNVEDTIQKIEIHS